MADIIHRVGIAAPPERVYAALTELPGLAGWWTEETRGDAGLGGSIEFAFRSPKGDLVGRMVMQVEALQPSERVRWRCLEGPEDWIGTTIEFDVAPGNGLTIVLFSHRGWTQATASMAHCSTKWAVFLLSLRSLVETGTGRPSPRDLKIDDWN